MLISSNKKYILSYGGGINSVALLLHILKNDKPLDEVIFADTGAELPDTYSYTSKIQKFLKDYDIPFQIVKSRGDDLYKRCYRRRVIPSQIWRWCTRDLKIRPIYAYYRSLKTHINQYLGISYEERDRYRESGVNYVSNIFPLIESEITRDNCIDLINDANLDLPVRSGCFFCPFNSVSRWCEIYKKHNHLFNKAKTLEENSKYFPKQKLMPLSLNILKKQIEEHETLPFIQTIKSCGSECII
jgi:3'-phosphoadenosine 5'-phosphosulfate sulfotransferase (PAPS reductase)/FAD synthetase